MIGMICEAGLQPRASRGAEAPRYVLRRHVRTTAQPHSRTTGQPDNRTTGRLRQKVIIDRREPVRSADGSASGQSFAAFSLIVAPAILTNASSVLAMSTSNRLARAVDRARDLARQLETAEASAGEMDAEARREFDRRLQELTATEQRDDDAAAGAAELLLRARRVRVGRRSSALLGAVMARVRPRRRCSYARIRRRRRRHDRRRRARARVDPPGARDEHRRARHQRARRKRPRAGAATIIGMTFGQASPDLLPGARNAVDVCLAIAARRARRARLPTRRAREVAASLEQALTERGASATCLPIESVSPRPMPQRAGGSAGRARAGRCRDPLRPAAGRRARRPHAPSSASSSGGGSATRTWSA